LTIVRKYPLLVDGLAGDAEEAEAVEDRLLEAADLRKGRVNVEGAVLC
jgi:hypothetical protein